MPSGVIESSENRPAEVVFDFIKKLDKFIEDITANIIKMKNKHQQMSFYWKGDQYNAFTNVLALAITNANKELNALKELREKLKKQAEFFRRGEGIR